MCWIERRCRQRCNLLLVTSAHGQPSQGTGDLIYFIQRQVNHGLACQGVPRASYAHATELLPSSGSNTGRQTPMVFTAAYVCASYCIFYGSSSMWADSIVWVSAARTMVMQRQILRNIILPHGDLASSHWWHGTMQNISLSISKSRAICRNCTVSAIIRVKKTQTLSEEGC